MAPPIGHRIALASGFSRDDCHILAWRYDERFGPDGRNVESWVVEQAGWRPRLALARTGMLCALWRSPTGRVYAVDGSDALLVYDHDDPPGTPRWQELRLRGSLEGVWGLSDSFVLVWGRDENAAALVHLWDGSRWHALPFPGRVIAMHGSAPDRVWAVGERGLALGWNGREWAAAPGKPIAGALWSVFVAEDGETWTCGPRAGLFKLGAEGWAPIFAPAWRPACVAKWQGVVWVGGRSEGLLRLEADGLVPVDAGIEAESFDARVALLVTTPTAVHEARSWDGGFEQIGLRGISGLGRDDEPRWEVLPEEDRVVDAGRLPDVDW